MILIVSIAQDSQSPSKNVTRRPKGARRKLAPWKDSRTEPVLYHVISRIVGGKWVMDWREKEHMLALIQMMEAFSGCRVVSYAIMGNHVHLLIDVPARPETGLDATSLDHELFAQRLSGIYPAEKVSEILHALDQALKQSTGSKKARARATEEIAGPYLARMHDLSEFMNGLLKRFTRWFNRQHGRTGALWDERFKSVFIENGEPAQAVADYIQSKPRRIGIVDDTLHYRWSR